MSKQLIGHTSPETAYAVDDYPYGFRLRTSIRYWIETREGFGQRFVSQTLNPKTGKWNKPKASTYWFAVVLVLGDDEHVRTSGVSAYADADTLEAFAARYVLDEYASKQVKNLAARKRQVAAKQEELAAKGQLADVVSAFKSCVEDDIARLKAGGELAA